MIIQGKLTSGRFSQISMKNMKNNKNLYEHDNVLTVINLAYSIYTDYWRHTVYKL